MILFFQKLFCSHQLLKEEFLYLSKWKFQSQAGDETIEESHEHLSDKNLAEQPHGEVHVVVLHREVVPVKRHVEQVSHEGNL